KRKAVFNPENRGLALQLLATRAVPGTLGEARLILFAWLAPAFRGAWALVNRVKVLFGATPNVDFRSFQSDGLLPEVFVELRIDQVAWHGRWPFQEGDHKKLR